jgi:hypothetical protein
MLLRLVHAPHHPTSVAAVLLGPGAGPAFSDEGVFGYAQMITALLDRLTYYYHILETGNDGFRFKASAGKPKSRKEKSAQHLRLIHICMELQDHA